MSLKLSVIPATAVAIAPTDLLYLAKDMGGSFLEHKLPASVLDAKYQAALGFTPENVANKNTDGTLAANSNILYPSQQAVKTYVDALAAASSAAYVLKAGDTMTGLLQFSGVTHAGIRLNNLTTAQRDAIAVPTAGMTVWNTTTTALNFYTGAAWTAATTGGPYLPLAGGTMLGDILFSPDDTIDLGASQATRIRTLYVGTAINLQKSGIGATPTASLALKNFTAAAAGAQQYSTAIRFVGQGWKTDAVAASREVIWQVYNRPVQGAANPTSDLLFDFSVNGGAFATKLCLSSAGVVELPNGTDPGADPATAGAQWVASGEWQYRTSAASEGAGQTNRVHNRGVTVNGAGTDYSLTTATARVDFGTTDPEVVLPTAGTYLLLAKVGFLGGVGTVNDSVTVKFRNSTDATDIGSSSLETVIANGLRAQMSLSAVVTVTASKTVQLFAFNFVAARGVVEALYTNISYVRLY